MELKNGFVQVDNALHTLLSATQPYYFVGESSHSANLFFFFLLAVYVAGAAACIESIKNVCTR